MKILSLLLCAGLAGCVTTAGSVVPATSAGMFLIPGAPQAVMQCAFWQGAGDEALMLLSDAGGSIIGPDGSVARFEAAGAGQTRVLMRTAGGEIDAALDRKMGRWLAGCPDSTSVTLPGLN